MKKSALSIVILAISIPLQAQTSEKEPETKTKTCYSIAWGLFKSKDCPDVKSVDVVIHKPEIATSASESTVENSDVETKRILWGALQWTVKKKKDE